MWELGLGRVVECGPGKVLCGLIKRIEPDMECYSTEDPESFAQAKTALTI
jgi:[acyl-carrier-protein] S-malonyltransferase